MQTPENKELKKHDPTQAENSRKPAYIRLRQLAVLTLCALTLCSLAACSTKKNTRMSRFYQSMTTRFNVYFNGIEAYKQGCKNIETSNKDNYLEVLPLYPIGNKTTIGSGSSDFDRAIEKSQKAVTLHSIRKKPKRKSGRRMSASERRYRSRIEFNPYLHHAWMLLGKAQFQKGDFPEAAATFAYVARLYETQPEIATEARLRLAECYTLLGWYYDAEDVLLKVNNDSMPSKHRPAFAKAYGNYLIGTERYKEAIPQLLTTIKHEKSKKQKAREYYLLGQIYQMLGDNTAAYRAFGKTVKLSPPYDLEISARIRQSEVIASRNSGKIIKKLRKMAKKEKNKDYLDQIYYAIGNIYLAEKDTLQAIKEYKTGVEKSTQSGPVKGIIDLTLGNLCWLTGQYVDAQTAYSEAIGLLDAKHESYKLITKRSKVLDELVPYTSSIELQDSLQHLASLDSASRMVVIDTLIARFVQKEKAEAEAAKKAERDQQREELLAENAGNNNRRDMNTPTMPTGDKSWYFYNRQLITQGKTKFESLWGKRKLEDNWRRKNKTVVALDEFEEYNYDEEETDSLDVEETAMSDSLEADTVPIDEKNPIFYLQQIPLTEEAMEESNRILTDALFNAAVIAKDKLEDFTLAEKLFYRLTRDFPDFEQQDETYYHLFLMHGRMKKMMESEQNKQTLKDRYPESEFTKIVINPDFVRDAIYGKHLEDSLYADTYQSFLDGNLEQVRINTECSATKYPLGAHRPKFLFLHAAAALQQNNQKQFLSELKELIQEYPEHEITDLAAHILKGVQEGRLLTGGGSMFGNIWASRALDSSSDSTRTDSIRAFNPEHATPYIFVLAYEEGKVNENQLLYEVAQYNFSTFVVKNFEMEFEHQHNIGRLVIRSFMNYEEALYYQRQLYADPHMNERLSGMKALVISEENYKLLNSYYSFDEYDAFYQEHFSPIDESENPVDGTTLDEPLNNIPEETETEETSENEDTDYNEEEEEEESDDDTYYFF